MARRTSQKKTEEEKDKRPDEIAELKEIRLRKALDSLIKGSSLICIKPPKESVMYNAERLEIKCYAKHFSLQDQIHLDDKYEEFFNKAQDSGIPTKKEALQRMYDSGLWTEEDEKWVASQKEFIKNLEETKSKLNVERQIKTVQKSIDEVEGKLKAKEAKRQKHIGTTCEAYANVQMNSYTMIYALYEDIECKEPLFSKDDQDYLSHEDIALIVHAYNDGMKVLDITAIKDLSVSPFFTSYFSLIEEAPSEFFGRPVYELSFYQLNLLSYARVLRSIIKNTAPPKQYHRDPDKLLEWAEKGEKARKLMEKGNSDDKAFSMVGAKQEDYEKMGVERKGKDIFNLAKEKEGKKKGTLSIMDFLDES